MGRFSGLIHSRARLLPCLLEEARGTFLLPREYPLAGWGFGYHQGSRIFLQKEPVIGRDSVDFLMLARQVEANDLVINVHRPPEGRWSYQNAQPFGYQHWIFAHHGKVPGFRDDPTLHTILIEQVAPFLRRNIQGSSDTELLFHLYLSELHNRGMLAPFRVPALGAAEAMAAVLRRVSEMLAPLLPKDALDELHLSFVASNGDILVAAAYGIPLHWRQVVTIPSCEECSVAGELPGHPRPAEDLGPVQAAWVASGLGLDHEGMDERWNVVADRSVLWADRAGQAEVFGID